MNERLLEAFDLSEKIDQKTFTNEGGPTNNSDRMPQKWRYGEGEVLEEIRNYLSSTYRAHYVADPRHVQGMQVVDQWEAADGPLAVATTCKHTCIKYLMRYGKKGGRNRKDLLKAAHYLILMMHYEELVAKDLMMHYEDLVAKDA